MSDQYDSAVAAMYDRSFTEIPLRRYVEQPSFYRVLGDVNGLSVLDLACGTGYYTREIRRRGAARALGVDLSEDMIRVARAREQAELLGVEYRVGDAGTLEHLGDFDLVTGIHLLHYASSLKHLKGMCHSISTNLKRGARFIGYQLNYDLSRAPRYYDKYCFNLRIAADAEDGEPFTFTVSLGDLTSPKTTACYWGKQSLECALHDAGLTDLQWIVPTPSPEGIAKHGEEFWTDLIRSPFELIVTCRKA